MRITSVLWLKDQVSIATGGSKDSVPKIWDIRSLDRDVSPIGPLPQPAGQQRLEGISSLSQDDRRALLSASCKDNRIYLYNTLQLERGPLRSYEGGTLSSHMKVNKPHEQPTILFPRDGENASLVDWSFSEFGKLATAGEHIVRIWDQDHPEME